MTSQNRSSSYGQTEQICQASKESVWSSPIYRKLQVLIQYPNWQSREDYLFSRIKAPAAIAKTVMTISGMGMVANCINPVKINQIAKRIMPMFFVIFTLMSFPPQCMMAIVRRWIVQHFLVLTQRSFFAL